VKCELREGMIVIDPFARGASLGVDDLQERLKTFAKTEDPDPALLARLLTAAPPREIWARMLRNLRAIYLSKGETLKALAASDRVLTLLPDAAEEYRERAELYAASECFRAAVADYREYLKLRPDAHDSRAVAERIAELEPVAARLN
jgi:regulator of sirC expression with transglutaminase-like and TPR domain